MKVTTIGLDIAKSVFQVHGVDERGKGVLCARLRRGEVLAFFAKLAPCLIGIEAGGGAHYWARELERLGHTARLVSPQYVTPYRRGGKNDGNDAAAIAEAVQRPDMPVVAVNRPEQQALAMLVRVRARLVAERTALGNQVRGFLAEYGIVLPQGLRVLRRRLPEILEDSENGLPGLAREVLADLGAQLAEIDERLERYEQRVVSTARDQPLCQRAMRQRGIGPVTAVAAVAALGDGRQFRNGRQMAASLGLVPRQCSTGGVTRLLGITKRGDRYLRALLIHGARTVVRHAGRQDDALSRWCSALKARRGTNIAAVALANKTARHLWAALRQAPEPEFAPA
ncbi:MAG TPA: IS110 family transposase [Burkholderiales bacterium]|nr:IS110 family transposase [Burkholderiales bacterium]